MRERRGVTSKIWHEYCTANARTHAGVLKTTDMSVTSPGANLSTRIEPRGYTNPVDPNCAPPLDPQGAFRAHLWRAAVTHPEKGHFQAENGKMSAITVVTNG